MLSRAPVFREIQPLSSEGPSLIGEAELMATRHHQLEVVGSVGLKPWGTHPTPAV
jgi:hypothetical protein